MHSTLLKASLPGLLLASALLAPLGECHWSFSSHHDKPKQGGRGDRRAGATRASSGEEIAVDVVYRPGTYRDFIITLDEDPFPGPGLRTEPAGLVTACRDAGATFSVVPTLRVIRSSWVPVRLLRFMEARRRWEELGARVILPPFPGAWLPLLPARPCPPGGGRCVLLDESLLRRLCAEPRGILRRIAMARASPNRSSRGSSPKRR